MKERISGLRNESLKTKRTGLFQSKHYFIRATERLCACTPIETLPAFILGRAYLLLYLKNCIIRGKQL